MGTKYSRQCPISYEDSIKRVSPNELIRLKNAFKRAATNGGVVTKQTFVKEVLGDMFPGNMAEYIYTTCGGNLKGLSFKDLVTGLVLLISGTQEEKIRFIFLFYANENGSNVQKNHMMKLIRETEGCFPDERVIAECFSDGDSVCFEDFAVWILTHVNATMLTEWLLGEPSVLTLSNDHDTPTFYQTLSGVTHLEESDILELEKRYWVLKSYSTSGKFDVDTLTPLVSPPLPLPLCQGLFNAFDENRDNHIDFKEMACGISACCRGPLLERQKFCFKIFDKNQDGFLDRSELETMITALLYLRKESQSFDGLNVDEYNQTDVDRIIDEMLEEFDHEKDGKITLEDYLMWTVKNDLPSDFTKLLFQICHIVLGLNPSTRPEEATIIRTWLRREVMRGLRVGQFWYLINMEWWQLWKDYVDFVPSISTNCDPASSGVKKANVKCSNMQNASSEIRSSESDLSSNTPSRTSSVQSLNQTPSYLASLASRASLSSLLQISTDSSKNIVSSPSHSPRSTIPQRPPAIDNLPLIIPNTHKVIMLTGEGGRLKRDVVLTCGRDFEMVPEAIWRALSQWYGGSPALPRQVIQPSDVEQPELELYPITLHLYRHQLSNVQSAAAIYQNHHLPSSSLPKRNLAYIAAFSRLATVFQVSDYICNRLRLRPENVRLWLFHDENSMVLLEDEVVTLEQLNMPDNSKVLIEVRSKDQTWPEEMSILMSQKNRLDKSRLSQTQKGLTGLNNLGNTCFMNAAVQCVSNTVPLTMYFNTNKHLYELNRVNPLGMKGHIAKNYGDLVKDLWSGTSKAIAPLKLRYTFDKFIGYQQQDCQEFLAFLLDGLHEDLNRVYGKLYRELKDSDGRPDCVVAQEAWEYHILRNKSIIVDLFHGQLKSKVTCQVCGHTSCRFDPFTYLSLPLPMESYIHIEVTVIKLDGSVPVKYGLRLNQGSEYKALRSELSQLCNIPHDQIVLIDVSNALVKEILSDKMKVRALPGQTLYAYEVAPPADYMFEDLSAKLNEGVSNGELSECGNSQATSPDLSCANNRNYDNGSYQQNEAMDSGDSGVFNNTNTSCATNSSNTSTTSVTSGMCSDFVEPHHTKIVIGIHRKMIRQEAYFLSSQKSRPSMFGQPIVIPINEQTTNQNIYELVWTQVSRFVSPLPPPEGVTVPNHAQDCDDSLGYEYPFVLKAVVDSGLVCAWCPWARFCRGCRIERNEDLYSFGSAHIAIDWDPTALHLRYQTAQEKLCEDDESVKVSRKLQKEPISLSQCLEAFTTNEQLSEDEKYYCSKCKQHQLACKKLQIFRLPPILIVQFKRFQLVHNHWVKSHKIVSFPVDKFCPTPFLASAPKEAVYNALSSPQSAFYQPTSFANSISPMIGCKKCNNNDIIDEDAICCKCIKYNMDKCDGLTLDLDGRFRSMSSNDDGVCCIPQDFHQHRLQDQINPFDLNYNLYSMACHTGIIGNGHYVCYAKNGNNKWYCYNDSSCKEVKEENMDKQSAYILFYEREGIDYSQYLPNVNSSTSPDITEIEEELEAEFKKNCVIL